MQAGIFLIILGLFICIFSHPAIRGPLMSRLFNEGLVTPRRVKPDKAEVVKFAGPNLSLFLIGFMVLIVGLFLLWT